MICNLILRTGLKGVGLFGTFWALCGYAQAIDKIYVGGSVSGVDIGEEVSRLAYEDSTLAITFYSGYQFSESLSAELALQKTGEVGTDYVLGSGLERFELDAQFLSTSIRARLTLDLGDLFDWQKDFVLFATAGLHETREDHRIRNLDSNAVERRQTTDTGLTIGGGVLHQHRRIRLRGFIDWFDRPGDRRLLVVGIGGEYRFSRERD